MKGLERVDRALDVYCSKMTARNVDIDGFRVTTLARIARVSPSKMGRLLQEYRTAQKPGGTTRYVVACRGYGSAARWSILAKPGTDPKAVQNARAEAARHSVRDSVDRFLSDVAHELSPPTYREKDIDLKIRELTPLVTDQLGSIVRHVDRVLNGQS